MAKTEKQKLKRVSFTMHAKYVSMLASLAEINSGTTMSHEVRRLINDEWNRRFNQDGTRRSIG